MRILIFSDTHGDINGCISVIDAVKKVDMLLHAGDCARDAEDLACLYPNIPLHFVAGNNDLFTNAPDDLLIHAGEKKIFLTHGHQERVKWEHTYETLAEKAKSKYADLVVFGHTHVPYTGYAGNLMIFNPGSMRYGGTYGVCEIDDGRLKTAVCRYR